MGNRFPYDTFSTANVKFKPTLRKFKDLLIQCRANIKAVAKAAGCTTEQVHTYLNEFEGAQDVMNQVRSIVINEFVDLAESVILYNMQNVVKDPRIAQKAAEFVLDRQGMSRGWVKLDGGNAQITAEESTMKLLDYLREKQLSFRAQIPLKQSPSSDKAS